MDAKRILEEFNGMTQAELEGKVNDLPLMDESKVEEGQIFEEMVYEGERHVVKLMALSPGAKTKACKINCQTEYRLFLETANIDVVCDYWETSIENPSKSRYLFILIIRVK